MNYDNILNFSRINISNNNCENIFQIKISKICIQIIFFIYTLENK